MKQNVPGGYHLKPITRGKHGELSKIQEELDECRDAMEQGNKIMVLQELSDILSAVEGFLHHNFSDFTMEDLFIMARTTDRAFIMGDRKCEE